MTVVQVVWEDWADTSLPLPAYETPGSAGADLRANLLPEDRKVGFILDPMRRAIIPTGIALRFQQGTRCRSARVRAWPSNSA